MTNKEALLAATRLANKMNHASIGEDVTVLALALRMFSRTHEAALPPAVREQIDGLWKMLQPIHDKVCAENNIFPGGS